MSKAERDFWAAIDELRESQRELIAAAEELQRACTSPSK